VDALSHEANLCVVYNPRFLSLFDRGQEAANPPLLKLVSAFEASSEHDGYIILRRHAGGV
jgi:hypothetical protein